LLPKADCYQQLDKATQESIDNGEHRF